MTRLAEIEGILDEDISNEDKLMLIRKICEGKDVGYYFD